MGKKLYLNNKKLNVVDKKSFYQKMNCKEIDKYLYIKNIINNSDFEYMKYYPASELTLKQFSTIYKDFLTTVSLNRDYEYDISKLYYIYHNYLNKNTIYNEDNLFALNLLKALENKQIVITDKELFDNLSNNFVITSLSI